MQTNIQITDYHFIYLKSRQKNLLHDRFLSSHRGFNLSDCRIMKNHISYSRIQPKKMSCPSCWETSSLYESLPHIGTMALWPSKQVLCSMSVSCILSTDLQPLNMLTQYRTTSSWQQTSFVFLLKLQPVFIKERLSIRSTARKLLQNQRLHHIVT